MSQGGEKLFLASFIVMGVNKKTNVPDQQRVRLVVAGEDDEVMRQRIKSFADGLGATFALEPVEKLDDVAELSVSIRRACQSRGFILAAMADQTEASQ